MTIEQVRSGETAAEPHARKDARVIAAAVVLSALYATLRYNVFKGVPWADWPHYVGNKVLAIASLVLIALSALRLASRRPRPIRYLMAFASGLALAHSLLSLALLEPIYFEKFFAADKLTLLAGVSLILGSLAMALLHWGKGRQGSAAPASAILPLGAIGFVSGLHAALPSVPSWFEPSTWPGSMPPITLISFVVGTVALAAALSFLARGRLGGGLGLTPDRVTAENQ